MKQVPFGPVRFDILQLKRKDRATINSIEELQEELDNTLTSVSGNPITISDASNTNAENFTVTLVPTQAGTGDPSPDNVRAISGVNSLKVIRNSKNLLPYPYTQGSTTSNGITYTMNSDGSISISGTCTQTHQIVLVTASGDWLPSGSYTFTLGNTGLYAIDVQARNSGTYVRSLLAIGEYADKTREFEFEVNYSDYNQISVVMVITAQRTVNTTIYPMIRHSSFTDDTYVPYQGTTITLSLGSTVYGGTINFSTGVLTVNKVGIVLDGSEDENWTCVETSGHYRGYISLTDIKALNSDTAITEVICDKIPSGKWPETYTGNFKLGQVGKNVGFGLDSLEITTTADLRTWLTSNNLQFVYPLATPTTTTLTAKQIRLLQGENYIYTTGSSMSFKYQRDNLIGELKAWVLDQLS